MKRYNSHPSTQKEGQMQKRIGLIMLQEKQENVAGVEGESEHGK